MNNLLSDRWNQLALLVLTLLFLTETLWTQEFLLLHYLALPAAGWLMGQFNREIENHILLHSIQLITLFAMLLLAIYASELGGSVGLFYFLITFSPAFYYGLRHKAG